MVSEPEASGQRGALPAILASLGSAVEALDPNTGDGGREQARAALAHALAGVLAAERKRGGSREALPEARKLLQALLKLVEDRTDVEHLKRARDQTRRRHAQLQQATAGELPLELDLWTSGHPDRQVDWWSIAPLSADAMLGVLGTVIGDEADVAVVGGALRAALSVACKGMGRGLGPERAHLVLHATLVDLFGAGLTVPALAFKLDTTERELSLACAGHRSLWHVRDGVFQTLRVHPGTPLGVEPVKRPRALELQLRPGDVLVGLSAGTFEIEGPDGSTPREADLRVALLQGLAADRSPATVLREALVRHAGSDAWVPQATVFSVRLR
ncbi:MAG: SpoIIE family protein phosphatase [Myxococcales bacterium]|nr:SpoIIE family protein phosphatase [Myxococcales bacterium]